MQKMSKKEKEERGRIDGKYSLDAYKDLIRIVCGDLLLDFKKSTRGVKRHYLTMKKTDPKSKKYQNASGDFERHIKDMLNSVNFLSTQEYYEWSNWVDVYKDKDIMLKEMEDYIDEIIPSEIRDKVKVFVFSRQERKQKNER